MNKIINFEPQRVFHYFEEISTIPRGSGNCKKISDYCVAFAREHGLKVLQDEAANVIIYKPASLGYENAETIILQGHLDMVCQKTETSDVDFEKDGIPLYTEGDFVKAKDTTLGADNGIAIAMILAILESKDIAHPPIEAVFTTDEEVGMLGALELNMKNLKGKKMINLDAEDPKTLTVSCAGGCDFTMKIPVVRHLAHGQKVILSIKGLQGGHSGVEIHKGRVNANMLAGRILNYAKSIEDFAIISINGGDKGNAIPRSSTIELLVEDAKHFCDKLKAYIAEVKEELSDREKDFVAELSITEETDASVLDSVSCDVLLFTLVCAPNGVISMSTSIENLVETSLNLGILNTAEKEITVLFSLRSNKKTAMKFLTEQLSRLAKQLKCEAEVLGEYPPWEYKKDSSLQNLYLETYREQFGEEAEVVALHAGLECGVFASAIQGLECIAIGPETLDVHTVSERLSISSTEKTYQFLLNLLKKNM